MEKNLPVIIASILGLSVLVLSYLKWGCSYVYDYSLKDEKLRFLLFRFIPLAFIRLRSIKSVETIASSDISIFDPAFRCGNRLVEKCLRIRMKRGVIQIMYITPQDPDRLLAQIQSYIEQNQG